MGSYVIVRIRITEIRGFSGLQGPVIWVERRDGSGQFDSLMVRMGGETGQGGSVIRLGRFEINLKPFTGEIRVQYSDNLDLEV